MSRFSKQQEALSPTAVVDSLLSDQMVERRGWLIRINAENDDVEVFPPEDSSEDAFAAPIGHLASVVGDFCKRADMPMPGVNKHPKDQVSVPEPSKLLGPDSATKDPSQMNPTINKRPTGTDPKGTSAPDTNLGKDTSSKNPSNFNPSINKRPKEPQGRGGLPDTSLGADTSGAPTNWSDKKVRLQDDGRTGAAPVVDKESLHEVKKPKRGPGQPGPGKAQMGEEAPGSGSVGGPVARRRSVRRRAGDLFDVKVNKDAPKILNKGENPSNPDDVIHQSKGEHKDERDETEGKKESRIVDSFMNPRVDPTEVFRKFTAARPSTQLLTDIMDPDKWTANNVFTRQPSGGKRATLGEGAYSVVLNGRTTFSTDEWLEAEDYFLSVSQSAEDDGSSVQLLEDGVVIDEVGRTMGEIDPLDTYDAEDLGFDVDAGTRIKENWGGDGAYGRDLEAESSEELHALTLALAGEEVDWTPFKPMMPEDHVDESTGAQVQAGTSRLAVDNYQPTQFDPSAEILETIFVRIEGGPEPTYMPLTPTVAQETLDWAMHQDTKGPLSETTEGTPYEEVAGANVPMSRVDMVNGFGVDLGVLEGGALGHVDRGSRWEVFQTEEEALDFIYDYSEGLASDPDFDRDTPVDQVIMDRPTPARGDSPSDDGPPIEAYDPLELTARRVRAQEYGGMEPGEAEQAQVEAEALAEHWLGGNAEQVVEAVADDPIVALLLMKELPPEKHSEFIEMYEGLNPNQNELIASHNAGCDGPDTEDFSDKESVDDKAKSYWDGYLGDYGKQLAKDDITQKGKGKGKPKSIDDGKEGRRQAYLRARKHAQAAAPVATPSPSPLAGGPAVPATPESQAPLGTPPSGGAPPPKTPGAPPPKTPGAPGAQPATVPPPVGDAGLQMLGWLDNEIAVMGDDDKKKILEIQLNKPGTKAPEKKPGTPPSPQDSAPAAPTPAPAAPKAPVPATPAAPVAGSPIAPAAAVKARVAEMVKRKIQRRLTLGQAAPTPVAPTPAAPAIPATPAGPTAPATSQPPAESKDPSLSPAGPGSDMAKPSDDQKAFQILSDVQQMQVNVTNEDQVMSEKSSILAQRLLQEVGMSMDEARKLFGLADDKSWASLLQ